eukprot:2256666-Amphidinium_carterae.1
MQIKSWNFADQFAARDCEQFWAAVEGASQQPAPFSDVRILGTSKQAMAILSQRTRMRGSDCAPEDDKPALELRSIIGVIITVAILLAYPLSPYGLWNTHHPYQYCPHPSACRPFWVTWCLGYIWHATLGFAPVFPVSSNALSRSILLPPVRCIAKDYPTPAAARMLTHRTEGHERAKLGGIESCGKDEWYLSGHVGSGRS